MHEYPVPLLRNAKHIYDPITFHQNLTESLYESAVLPTSEVC